MSNVVTTPATEIPASATKVLFMTIEDLKARFGVTQIGIIRNPNTNKLFADMIGANIRLKVEQNIDTTQPIRFLYESDEQIAEGCIVNVKTDNTIATL